MHDILVIVLELHLQELFPIDNQIIPHTGFASKISFMSHYHTLLQNHKNFLLLLDPLQEKYS